MTRKTFWLASILFLAAALFLGIQLIQTAYTYKTEKETFANAQNYENRLLDFDQWLPDGDNGERKEMERAAKNKMLDLQMTADRYSGFVISAIVLYLAFLFFYGRNKAERSTALGGLLLAALVCLSIGLFTPILEIAAFERDLSIPVKVKTEFLSLDIDYTAKFEGEMYFYYQSKSIVELIGLLLRQGNWIVGISILVFSLLFPLGKTLFTLLALLKPNLVDKPLFSFFIFKTSKWSMADVFVAAIFLSFLAFNNMQTGIQTDSNILWGLYYFLAYCMLAILSAVLLQRQQQQQALEEVV
ncbi:MAG: paraquat-inducible protein A [Cyanothece sp. SIO1E1]|nr:paraquat-inducible protein A [Cyanothece sp. SIO1E1]